MQTYIYITGLQTSEIYVTFQVLTVASMNIRAFWNVAPCSLLDDGGHVVSLKRRSTPTRLYGRYVPEGSNLQAKFILIQ
jgi:hypothetical protein